MDTTCDLTVLVPTRGRPQAATDLVSAFIATCSIDTNLMFIVDSDDEHIDAYRALHGTRLQHDGGVVIVKVIENVAHTMVYALNAGAVAVAAAYDSFAIGFMGDDHRPRTIGWDQRYVNELGGLATGFVYGNDLVHGPNLPTQVALTANIVRTLGRIAPESLRHLYVDNYWRDLGNAAQCIRYLPDVVIEHMHPGVGKAEWDEGHIRVNAPEVWTHDESAYAEYMKIGFDADVKALWRLRGGMV